MHPDKPAAARKDRILILRLIPAPSHLAKTGLTGFASPIVRCLKPTLPQLI